MSEPASTPTRTIPVRMLPGNHETGSKRLVEPDVAVRAVAARILANYGVT